MDSAFDFLFFFLLNQIHEVKIQGKEAQILHPFFFLPAKSYFNLDSHPVMQDFYLIWTPAYFFYID